MDGPDASHVGWAMDPSCVDKKGDRDPSVTFPCERVGWETRGDFAACQKEAGTTGFLSAKVGCDEEGSVQFKGE
jgi:hypothetical protein